MEAYIVIFLLFFAVLAFGWFYLQRAKTREAAKDNATATATPASADEPTTTPPSE